MLLKITLTDSTVYYLVRNTEDIVFNGQTYTAVNFEIEPSKQSGSGEIPTVTLRISNVTRILQASLEATNGGVDSEVVMTVVNAALLAENYAELQLTFSVLSTKADAYWVSFTLGSPNLLRRRFPQYRFIAEHCNWQFLEISCAYAGWKANTKYLLNKELIPLDGSGNERGYRYQVTQAGTTGGSEPGGFATGTSPITDGTVIWTKMGTESCRRTLDDCRALVNQKRFGGHPGLGGGNVRFA